MSGLDYLRKYRYDIRKILEKLDTDIESISGGKKRILYIAPHLSTGGMPQYLLKKIQLFNDLAEIYCVQWENNAPLYDVQRRQIGEILGNRFYCLDGDKEKLLDIIESVCPDVIHIEDIPERFIPRDIIEKIYKKDRPYFICETPHSSTIEIEEKSFLPDKFVMVNKWMCDKYSPLGCQFDVLEYPIENLGDYDKNEFRELLEMDPSKKHIINVGLFTPGKNQAELIEIAREMIDYPVQFHFIGNQASNFVNYWKPLNENLPENCKLWGERGDTENFYKAADLFVFTSVWELSPIVIKESLSYRLPIMMRRLPSYLDEYDKDPHVTYLTGKKQIDVQQIIRVLNLPNE